MQPLPCNFCAHCKKFSLTSDFFTHTVSSPLQLAAKNLQNVYIITCLHASILLLAEHSYTKSAKKKRTLLFGVINNQEIAIYM